MARRWIAGATDEYVEELKRHEIQEGFGKKKHSTIRIKVGAVNTTYQSGKTKRE